MKITITDMHTAATIENQFEQVVSLIDPSLEKAFIITHPNHHVWFFDDIIAPHKKHSHPTLDHVVDILAKVDKTKNTLIHCHAGIGRSTAVSIGLLIADGWTVEQAHNHILMIRKMAWPNDLILQHFDDILKLNGELVRFDKAWKDSQKDVLVW